MARKLQMKIGLGHSLGRNEGTLRNVKTPLNFGENEMEIQRRFCSQSDGWQTPDEERIRAFFGRKWGQHSGMWKRLSILGKTNCKSNVDFVFFFTLASKGHFRHIINCIAFLSILRLCLGVGLNSVTYMDHLLIFGPSWAQNTILPKEIPYT